jgi:hypothetical protein
VDLVGTRAGCDFEDPVPEIFGCVRRCGRAVGSGCHRSLVEIGAE